MAVKDILGRPIEVDDFVVFHNLVYQVVGVGQPKETGYGSVKMLLLDKAKTTRPVIKYSKDLCRVPAEDVVIWRLTQ